MPQATPDLLVITKLYDFVLWSCHHIARFPRSHRFTLGDRLEVRLYGLLDLLLRAKYTREREDLLRTANIELECLRFQLRLAKDLKCLTVESYGFAARLVQEIGRLVGGWLRAMGRKKNEPQGERQEMEHEAPRRPVGDPDEL